MRNSPFVLLLSIASILCLHLQCIDPIGDQPTLAKRLLVVEGGITTEPGPHDIYISKSAQFGSRAVGEIELISDAKVFLRTDIGEQIYLNKKRSGLYTTPEDFKAEVGRTYTLFINLENGEHYASIPELVTAVPPIDQLRAKFVKLPGLDEQSRPVGIDLYVEWTDPADEDNFYLWETRGEYKVFTRPDLYVACGGGGCSPAPKDCCELCYVNDPVQINERLEVFSDLYTNGQQQESKVAFIQDDGDRFHERFMAVLKKYSITKDAYAFFNVLNSQLDIDGEIFDPPPGVIRGNMINLTKPDDTPIGHFWAADITRDTLFIDRAFLTDPLVKHYLHNDCRVVPGASTTKPSYWPD